MRKFDLTTRTVAIQIFGAMWLIELTLAVYFSVIGGHAQLETRLWEIWGATNLALATQVNGGAQKGDSENGGSPENPTK